jgi:Ca-activated chloride channel family protein
MKRWIGLLVLAGIATSAFADGLIIVREPVSVPRGHYAFAPLEVTYHKVHVRINGPIAITTVEQEFYNPSQQRLEGTYLFPVPKGGPIDKFSMEIGGKMAEAELLSAEKARKIYEEIVRKMRAPALLEYADRDAFKGRIFPIEPHSHKRVALTYTQVLRADSGLVRYVYPLNTEKFSAKPLKTVSIKVELETKRPLKSVYSPTHNVEIRRHGSSKATIGFESTNVRPDTDFELFFASDDADVAVNLLNYGDGSEDGWFLLLAAPGIDVKKNQIASKDVAFVLDTSGSMAGDKLLQAKKALQFCVDNLNDGDRFEVIRFSTEVEPLFDRLVNATEENRKRAAAFIKELRPMGGTAIDEALRKALELRPEKSDRPYVIIFLTDGRLTIGVTSEEQIVSAVSKASAANIRVFCYGIGSDVNTHLLDKIAEATRAFSQYVLADEDIEVKVSSFFSKINAPVLTEVKLNFSGDVRVSRIYPSPLPDLYRGEQLIVAGRYTGGGDATVVIEGTVNGALKTFRYNVKFPARDTENDFIPRLWAMRRIGFLLEEIRLRGESSEWRDEVTELARKFGIVTPYTAYLIVEDEERRNVPVVQRTLSALEQDRDARSGVADAWNAFRTEKVGESAVAGSRFSHNYRQADSAESGLASGAVEAKRGLVAAAPMSAPAAERIVQYTQQTRFVRGRTFFRNGEQWMDARVQQMLAARRVQVQFNSPEYFELIAKHPNALAWFSVGRNIQIALGDTIYEITD